MVMQVIKSTTEKLLPSGECLHRITAAAAMVEEYGRENKALTKNYFYLATIW